MAPANTTRVPLAALALGITLLAAVVTPTAAQSENSNKGLQGTWHVQVTLRNCQTNAPLGPAFASVLAFHGGGTLTGTTSNPGFQPGQRSSDFGIWRYQGDRLYWAKSEAYVLFSSAPNPPLPGFQRGVQRITQVIEVDGDQFNAAATVQFFDTTGAPVTNGCATASGERFN